ncbi:MAG TPA: glycerophosphodiester phosphodiesterase family protein [Gemmataceae bacterium]|jgi:glycerophosphoryl diester phosphodiesterase|nr:glycerophosphodiester phosphodiesterase family protein [Gemmataceae bacterium]
MIAGKFHLQGHRGLRGTSPENTLPSFEQALDARVSSIETDIHLTRDGVPALCHDPFLSPAIFRLRGQADAVVQKATLVRDLTLQQLREYVAGGKPDPSRFNQQRAIATPAAQSFATAKAMDPFSVPTLRDLIEFAQTYAGSCGESAGKTAEQRRRAARLTFDLEIKFIPFHASRFAEPEFVIDRVLEIIRQVQVESRVVIRSFDHRLLKRIREVCPALTSAILIAAAVPINPVRLVRDAGASIYCPLYEYVDAEIIRECHREGVGVLPWTVNEREDWQRLLEWGVDGITSDYPDRLGQFLESQGIEWE